MADKYIINVKLKNGKRTRDVETFCELILTPQENN